MNIIKKRIAIVMFSLLFLMATENSLSYVAAQTNPTGTVRGVITDKSTGRVVPDATVSLEQSGSIAAETISTRDGAYIIEAGVCDYDLKVSKTGFKESVINLTVTSQVFLTTDVVIVPVTTSNNGHQTVKTTGTQSGTTKNTINIFGFIKGSVTEKETALNITGAEVSLTLGELAVDNIITENDGEFFFQPSPGNYNIRVVKTGFGTVTGEIQLSAFETVTSDFQLGSDLVVTPDTVSLCAQGGSPVSIRTYLDVLELESGKSGVVKIRVLKEDRAACSTEVTIACEIGCGKIELADNTIITNNQGIAKLRIRAKKQRDGLSIIKFMAGNIEVRLPVKITKPVEIPETIKKNPPIGFLPDFQP